MDRRKFIAAGSVGAAATTLAAPAIAQDVRNWKLVSAWPKNLPGPGVAAQTLADRITTLSGGRINVTLYAAGEIVPGNGVFDAVSEGTAELYHAVPAYWGSKSKGILLFGSQPFGLRADEQFGWMYRMAAVRRFTMRCMPASASSRSCAATPVRNGPAGSRTRSIRSRTSRA
jgi:TRAP-type mannitol/chloroaromatic compound transport system substrate-binding protein